MITRLYKLYLLKYRAEYYDLSADEKTTLRAKMDAAQAQLGIHDLFNAEMAWSNEQYETFGVEFCPSLEAAQSYAHILKELGWFRYVDSESHLGIPMDSNYPDFSLRALAPEQKPVYRLYFSRRSEYSYTLPQEEIDRAYGRIAEVSHLTGAQTLLNAYARWNNETWEYFAIERFPSMENLISFSQYLSDNRWYRLIDSRSYLGTAYGGLASGV